VINYSGPYLAPNGLPWLSASQVEGFADCERKWGLRYLAKLKHQDPSAALGTRIHEIAEAWLKAGTPPDEQEAMVLPDKYHASGQWTYYPGQIFKSGMHMLKHAVQHGPKIEGFFRFKSQVEHEIYWQGAKDLSWFDGVRVHVGDHKSSKNPKKYGKNAKKLTLGWQAEEKYAKEKGNATRLLCDTQALLYAHEARETPYKFQDVTIRPDADVGLGWYYYPTRPSNTNKPNAVEVIAPRDHVLEQVASIEGVAKRTLQMYREKPDPKKLPFNTEMCDGYGGCPFKETEHCDAHKHSFFGQLGDQPMANDTSFLSFISEKFPVQGAPPPAPAMVPPPPPALGPPIPPTSLAFESDDSDARAKAFIAQVTATAPGALRQAVPPPPPAPPVVGPVGTHTFVAAPMPPAVSAALGSAPSALDIDFTGRPRVESGYINAPESPMYAPASPEEAAVMVPVINTKEEQAPDELDGLDRDTLKKVNITLGLCTESSRFQEPRLRANIREFAQVHGRTIAECLKGPVYVATEEVQAEFEAKMKSVIPEAPPSLQNSPMFLGMLEGDKVQQEMEAEEARGTLENTQLTAVELVATKLAGEQLGMAVGHLEDVLSNEIRQVVREELARFFSERFGR
jgi:PD-(D/E)XK nuclease superfamily